MTRLQHQFVGKFRRVAQQLLQQHDEALHLLFLEPRGRVFAELAKVRIGVLFVHSISFLKSYPEFGPHLGAMHVAL